MRIGNQKTVGKGEPPAQLTLTVKDGSIVGKPVPVQISAETYKAIRDNQGRTHTTNHPNNLRPPKKKKDKQPADSGGI